MKLGMHEFTTRPASFVEDVEAYSFAGFAGIGLAEAKLSPDDASNVELLAESGLRSTGSTPTLWTVLPNALPMCAHEPRDVARRVEALCASVRRLAVYQPTVVIVMTGPTGDRSLEEASALVTEGLKAVASVAKEVGVTIALEPVHPSNRDVFSFLTSVGETADFIDHEAELSEMGIVLDTYQVWESPTLFADIERLHQRVLGVHLADWKASGIPGHLLPGKGDSKTVDIVRALYQVGWDGYLDVEVVSPDHYWKLPAGEVAVEAYSASVAVVAEATETDAAK